MKKRKNPLYRRILRELKINFGKYLVIFLLLSGSIGFVSGFLVADGSMIIAYEESFEKYRIEDGNFLLQRKASQEELEELEQLGITVYENFYAEEEVGDGSTLRIFANRTQVDLVCLMQGELPQTAQEIAIDRMYADNNGIQVGDSLAVGEQELTVCGLVALSDYSALFQNNNDTMFDAVRFGVAIMTQEGLDLFGAGDLQYSYAWLYEDPPADETEEKERAEELLPKINEIVTLSDAVPRFLNQAIQFTGEDMGSDKAMMTVLLYIIIAIMAFVFGVTTDNTIVQEAGVIGTLRASGYTKAELLRHYLTLPLLVTIAGALVGNVLGYSVFRIIAASLYYGSYSLPTYHTVWNAEAFYMTTLIPFLLMLLINLAVLSRRLSLSPLQFIRKDLSRRKRKKAIRLKPSIPFFDRFRIRILIQNAGSYATMLTGILFANLLLMFGLMMPAALSDYQENIVSNLICRYQYVLNLQPVTQGASLAENLLSALQTAAFGETKTQGAEKYAVASLKTQERPGYLEEQITIYGVQTDSAYVHADFSVDGVYITESYAQKYQIGAGDEITLLEPYGEESYTFVVAGTYDYPAALAIFLPISEFNRTFGYGESYFNGYFSDEEITDLNDSVVSTVIDEEALTRLSRQLDVSMGSMMNMLDVFSVLLFLILVYLLSRLIMEKNASSISMVKILGYSNKEIGRLYLVSTAIAVGVSLLISLPLDYLALQEVMYIVLKAEMKGWILFGPDPVVFARMLLLGAASIADVAALEYRKLGKVPMEKALKNAE